jgi:tetratricopeptide (TPR) repeat protein
VETLRSLVDRGAVVERDGGLVLVADLGDLNVPASLGSLLAARLDALEPDERQLVKAMSVFGGTFPRGTAAALGGVDEARIDGVLASLVRKQVLAIRADHLSPDRGQYGFAQGLLRTVAYEMLSRQERKARHLAAAEHLRQVFPGEGEEVAEAIATHLLDAFRAAQDDPDAADIRERAIAALRRAALRAGAVGAPEVAERTFLVARDLAIDESERVELAELAGETTLQSGRYESGLALFEEVLAAYEARGEDRAAARVVGRIGFALTRVGRNDEAVSRINAALEVLGPQELDPEVGELNAHLGFAYAFIGDYARANVVLERALQIATDLKMTRLFVRALNTKVVTYVYLGRVVESRALLRTAIELAEQEGLTDELARAQNNTGNLSLQWDIPDSEEHLEASMVMARRGGNRHFEGLVAGNLSFLYMLRGRWRELGTLLDGLLADGEDRPGREYVHQGQLILKAHCGHVEEAATELAMLSDWRESDDADLRATFMAGEIVVALFSGREEDTLRTALDMLPMALASIGAASDPFRMGWPIAVTAAARAGRLEDLRTVLSLLADAPPGRVPPFLQVELARGQALLAAAEGRHDEVETGLRTSIEGLAKLGYPYHLAITQLDLAEWLFERSRAPEALELAEQAIATLSSLGAAPDLERAQSLLRHQTVERSVGV